MCDDLNSLEVEVKNIGAQEETSYSRWGICIRVDLHMEILV